MNRNLHLRPWIWLTALVPLAVLIVSRTANHPARPTPPPSVGRPQWPARSGPADKAPVAPAVEPVLVKRSAAVPPDGDQPIGAAQSAGPAVGGEAVARDEGYRKPLAFDLINPAALTPAIAAKLAEIQAEFAAAIGDTSNPADPAYADRWVRAQITADDRYRALFGWEAFREMQRQREHDQLSKRD